jgi:O-antigen ligase
VTALAAGATTLAITAAAAPLVILAAAAGSPALALGAGAALAGAVALVAHPFLGVAALAVFSHLDAVEKALLGFLPISAYKLITAATVGALLLNARGLRARMAAVLREPATVMVIVFLALAVVSMAGAEDRGLALAALRRLLSLGLLFLIVAILADTRRKTEALIWILVATSLVSSLILLTDFALGIQLVAQSDAATTARTVEGVARSAGGADYNPTTAASLLLVGVVFALVHALETPAWRWPLLVVVGIGTIAVVLSFARSAALAYGLITLALVWRHRRSRLLPLVGAAAVLVGLAALPLIPSEYWQRLSAILGGAADPTLGRRWSYIVIGFDLFVHSPLFGTGPGSFVHHFLDVEYRFMPGRVLIGRELHNMYLSVLVQHGLMGAAPFFAVLAISFRNLGRIRAAPVDAAMATQALALGYAFAAYLLTCLFLPSEEIKYTWLLPAIVTALHLANMRRAS